MPIASPTRWNVAKTPYLHLKTKSSAQLAEEMGDDYNGDEVKGMLGSIEKSTVRSAVILAGEPRIDGRET